MHNSIDYKLAVVHKPTFYHNYLAIVGLICYVLEDRSDGILKYSVTASNMSQMSVPSHLPNSGCLQKLRSGNRGESIPCKNLVMESAV